MVGKRKASRIAAAVGVVLAATCGLALAHGWDGHGGGGPGGDGHLFMLAKVAGVDHSTMHTAFMGDTNLKTDFANVKSTDQALMTCLASGGTCDTQISAFASAQQALTMEKYKVWEGLFKSAPNTSKSTALLGQMQQLAQQRHAIFQQAFGTQAGSDTPDAPPPTPVE
ncbi:MAG TPA: hypothetical protein VNF28_05215 [Candidatus Binataceae bacterium]|nr:hypothetical protein [Candidatus Binataceae bacterium]